MTSMMKKAVSKRKRPESTLVDEDNERKGCKISEKEEEKICSRWSHLPDYVLEEIMKRLSLTDYLGLRAVCSPWRATIANAIANKHCLHLPEPPLVALPSEKKLSLYHLGTERVFCTKTVPLFEGAQTCHGSVEGWLIVGKNAGANCLAISFLNPVTNAEVLIPSVLKYYPSNSRIFGMRMRKMVASSNPNCSGEDCFVAGLLGTTPFRRLLAFCRLFDKPWTIVEPGNSILDMKIHGGKLYVITDLDSILVYDLLEYYSRDHDLCPPKPKILAKGPHLRAAVLPIYPQRHGYVSKAHYFLANDGALRDLLLIRMMVSETSKFIYYNNTVNEEPRITGIEVFKLDMNDQWVKVDGLGDRVLFLSKIQCTVMSSAALNSMEEKEDLFIRNSIYFAFRIQCAREPRNRLQVGMFCFTDNSIKYFSVEKSSLGADALYPFWFMPFIL